MAINPYHTVDELGGVRCSIIEKGITSERAEYIKTILEASHQKVVDVTDAQGKHTIGVTDITYNSMYALYGRRLRTADGRLVTPSIWTSGKASEGFYWENRK
jgi:hypothetical protein